MEVKDTTMSEESIMTMVEDLAMLNARDLTSWEVDFIGDVDGKEEYELSNKQIEKIVELWEKHK